MMEAHFYDLHEDPFAHRSQPAWYFASRGHQAALQALIARFTARQACVLLLGEAGVGKTFLLHTALAHCALQHLTAVHVSHPHLAWHDICEVIGHGCGLPEVTDDATTPAQALHRALLAEHERGRQVVLVIDDADAMPVEALAPLVRLSHCRTLTGAPLLQIVLAGLPGLGRHFCTPPLRPFTPPRGARVQLAPLTYRESLAYIRHRLQHAGAGAGTVFASGAVRAVARWAGGRPRVLNELCAQLLRSGFHAGQRPIAARTAQDVLTMCGAKRSRLRWWGVTAASLLVVGAIVGLSSSASPRVAERGLRGLVPLTRGFLTAPTAETPRHPAALGASPAEPLLVLPLVRQHEPAPPARAIPPPGRAGGQDLGEGASGPRPLASLESQRLETLPPPRSRRIPTPPPAASPPSAAPAGRPFKSCDALKAEIQAKLDAKNITGYALTILASGDLTGQPIVGSCEGNTKKIAYTRSRKAP